MRTWCIDFENEELGISVDAKTKEQAVEIAENPCNWKDGKKRKVSSVYEFQKGYGDMYYLATCDNYGRCFGYLRTDNTV